MMFESHVWFEDRWMVVCRFLVWWVIDNVVWTDPKYRSGAAAPPSSVLQSWLCVSTKEPSGFPVNHWKPRELSVASANHHMPLKGEFGNLCLHSIGQMPSDRKLASPRRKPCDPDTCPPLRRFRTASSHTGQTGAPHQSDRCAPPVRPIGQTGLGLLFLRLRFFSFGFVDQPRNLVVF
jgi:hypothetical protein